MTKLDDKQLRFLQSTLENLDFGSIVITVHDGAVTQIDTTKKKRFNKYSLAKKTIKENS